VVAREIAARPTLFRLAAAGAGIASALLLLELIVRAVLAFDDNFFDSVLRRPPRAPHRDLTLFDFIQPHPDDRVVYELRPSVRGRHLGHDLTINAFGMRDAERRLEKQPGTYRIIGLGDSQMFGWGVERDETFVALLERLLNEHARGRRFEVWNLAVPGYNTVQEVRAFELRLDRLEPDLVIINYVDNDMDLPNFLGARPSLRTWKKSYLVEQIRRRLAIIQGESLLPLGLLGVPMDQRTLRLRMNPTDIPERYRALYGWDNMEAAFRHLIELTKARGIQTLMLFDMDDYRWRLRGHTTDVRPRAVRELAGRCASHGYRIVDAQDRIFDYLVSHHVESEALWIAPLDSHPNAIRHRLVAETLFDALAAAGVINVDAGASGP